MKIRLNICCLLVLLLMGYSLVESLYYFTVGLKAGADPDLVMQNLEFLAVLPDDMTLLTDSVYNVKSQSYVPATFSHLLVSVEKPHSVWLDLLRGVMGLTAAVCFLWAALLFIRLMVAINRQEIFCWSNVHRLRRIGVLMSLGFLMCALQIYCSFRVQGEVFAMQGYSFSLREAIDLSNLLLGLVALIVAEVFALGLKLKEEQELTI